MEKLLSACILCKTADAALARCVRSLGKLPDELIVVSDEDAAQSVRDLLGGLGISYPTVVLEHQWRDDFSEARNAALKRALAQWIFFVDTDEELIGPSVGEFRSLLTNQNVQAYWVKIIDRTSARDDSSATTHRWHLSLFRNRADWQFRGRVHEELYPHPVDLAQRVGGDPALAVPQSSVLLRHDGYFPELLSGKLRRNNQLIEMQLREHPGQLYYLIELGRNLIALGEPRGHEVLHDAVRYLAQQVDNRSAPLPLAAALLDYLLADTDVPAHATLSRRQCAQLAQRWFPNSPALVWRMANHHFKQGEFEAAAKAFEQVLATSETSQYDQTLSFDVRVLGAQTRLYLGVCKGRLADLEAAERILAPLVSDPVVGSAARQNLEIVRDLIQSHSNVIRRSKPGDITET
jgi:tetratricopeptide (TPR) repeat protein